MRGLIIRDGTHPEPGAGAAGFLAFDLADVLKALGAPALDSAWRCRDVWLTSDAEGGVPELALDTDPQYPLSGPDLLRAAQRVRQVIDGEFEAVRAPGAPPWLIVRAVDSSWWEVFTDDPEALAAVRAAFRQVEDAPEHSPGAA